MADDDGDGRRLCVELDRLLKHDPLIDELAFLPSVDPSHVFGPSHEVRRCKLDPGLKAPLVSNYQT